MLIIVNDLLRTKKNTYSEKKPAVTQNKNILTLHQSPACIKDIQMYDTKRWLEMLVNAFSITGIKCPAAQVVYLLNVKISTNVHRCFSTRKKKNHLLRTKNNAFTRNKNNTLAQNIKQRTYSAPMMPSSSSSLRAAAAWRPEWGYSLLWSSSGWGAKSLPSFHNSYMSGWYRFTKQSMLIRTMSRLQLHW